MSPQAPDPNPEADADGAVEILEAAPPPDAPTLRLPARTPAPAEVPTLHDLAEPAPPGDDPDLQAVVRRVLAWHNRHRLARPIRAEQVDSVGVVALPFRDQGRKGPRPGFDEDFAAPLSLRAVRRFAARHAVSQRPGGPAWPQRQVKPRRADTDGGETRYLLTAAIRQGERRLRLLLAPADGGPVIGPRQWRWPPRLVALGAGLALALLAGANGGLAWWLWPVAAPAVTAVTAAAGPPAAPASAVAAASAPMPAASSVAHAQVPAPARTKPLTPVRVAPVPAAPEPPPAAGPAAQVAPGDDGLALYALVSRPAPTQALAEHDRQTLRELIALEPHATASHLEVVRLNGRWLVVWWPFVTTLQAEQARSRWLVAVPTLAPGRWQVLAF